MENLTKQPSVNTSSKLQFVLIEFEDELKNISGKCLDVGCADGDLTRYFILPAVDPKAIIIGTDLSKNMIKESIERHSDEKRLKFEILDIEDKVLPEKYVCGFDHVFSFYTLHWCNDIRQAFENIYRALQPGGTMLILMCQTHDMLEVLLQMSKDKRYESYIKDMNVFIPPFYDSAQPVRELRTLLKNVGFKVLHCSHRERTYSDQVADKLPDLLISFSDIYIQNMPCQLQEQFREEFVTECRRRRSHQQLFHNQDVRVASDLHEILIAYAQKQ